MIEDLFELGSCEFLYESFENTEKLCIEVVHVWCDSAIAEKL